MMPTRSAHTTTPVELKIRSDLRFDFSNVPAVHCDNNPAISHFFNALSIVAPPGEKLLIEVIRGARGRVKDPDLSTDAQAFAGQEALHSRHHSDFNKRLAKLGYDVDRADAIARAALDDLRARLTQRQQLAFVLAAEHLIYETSRGLLTDPRLSANMHPEVRRLFVWHAAEEMEHQSVAQDVYAHLHGDGIDAAIDVRKAWWTGASVLVTALTRVWNVLMEKESTDSAQRREFLNYMLVSPGYLRHITSRSGRFLMPGFKHWSDPDDPGLIERALGEVYGDNASMASAS